MNPLSANKKSDEAWQELAVLFAADGENALLIRIHPPMVKMRAVDEGSVITHFCD